MQEKLLFILNYLFFTITAVVLLAAQAGILHFEFGGPIMWVPLIVYWVQFRAHGSFVFSLIWLIYIRVHRGTFKDFVCDHCCCRLFSACRSQPLLWSGASQFASVCGVACLALPFITFGASFIFEEQTQSFFQIWKALFSPPLTALMALPLFFVFQSIDRLTQKEHPKTVESEAL